MTVLFQTKNDEGDVLEVVQKPDGSVHFLLVAGGEPAFARLPAAQAVALATAILAVLPGHAMHHAETLDDDVCAAIGQAYLLPAAKRSLARKAAAETPPPEAAN